MVRRHFLCDDLPSPDPASLPDGALTPPPISLSMTSRERWTLKTSPAACLGCHSQVNGLGFALEKFDGMGRFRSAETVTNPQTNLVVQLPIDDTVEVLMDGTTVLVNGPRSLSQVISQSPQANRCFARQWFRFSQGRVEDLSADACAIQGMESVLMQNGGSMMDMFKQLTLSPSFSLVRPKL
jgi:hypothetical protein